MAALTAGKTGKIAPRSLLAAPIVAAVCLYLAIATSTTSPIKLALIAAVVPVGMWLVATEKYEWSLLVLMVYLGLLDGFIKLETGRFSLTLVRDAILYLVACGAIVRGIVRREKLEWPPLSAWVMAFVLLVLAEIANPGNYSLTRALAATRPHLEWVPLFFFGYYVMRTERRLRGFLLTLVVLAANNGAVSFVQFNLTPAQFASWGPGYNQFIYGHGVIAPREFILAPGQKSTPETTSGHTRPFGLGGDSGFGGALGMLACPAVLALIATSRRKFRSALLLLPLAAGIALAVVTSQSRAAVVAAAIAVIAFTVLSVTARRAIPVVVTLVLAGFATVATVAIVQNSSTNTLARYQSISPGRVLNTTFEYRKGTIAAVPKDVRDFPLGAGTGLVGPAAGFGSLKVSNLDAESEPTYLLIELGVPGLLLLLGFNLRLLGIAVRRIRRTGDPQVRVLLAAVGAPLFAMFASWVVGIMTANSPGAPFFWFAAGTLSYWLITSRRASQTARAPLRS